jgi:hypothetical protein
LVELCVHWLLVREWLVIWYSFVESDAVHRH